MINSQNLDALPEDGSVYLQLPCDLLEDEGRPEAGGGAATGVGASAMGPVMMRDTVTGEELDMDASGFVGRPPAAPNSEAVRRVASAVVGDVAEPLADEHHSTADAHSVQRFSWATASHLAESEWGEGYIVRAFPLLFTLENADLNDKSRVKEDQPGGPNTFKFRSVAPAEYFQRMMHSWDSYMSCYPFARDPRFKFLAFNMTLRRRTLELSNVFSRQLPRHTTREQVLWQLGQDNDFTIKKLMARMAPIKGTRQHIIAQRNRMMCWALNGLVEQQMLPHIFLTTSEAELHNPFLHKLLDELLPSTADIDSGKFGTYPGQVCRKMSILNGACHHE